MKKSNVILSIMLCSALVLGLTVSFNANNEFAVNDAYAQDNGTCCPEKGSYCIFGDVTKYNYYWKNEPGPCKTE